MKKSILALMIISLISLISCKKEEPKIEGGIGFSLDIPNDFYVTKGYFVDKIILDWNMPPKVEQIEIFRFDSALNDYKSIGFSSTVSYIDTINFAPNAYYYYKIRAYNSFLEMSDFTNYEYGYVSGFESPLITEIGYGDTETFIDIVWSNINGSDYYTIFRSDNNDEFFEIGTSESNNYSDSENILAGKNYFYKIKAFNPKLGFSNFSPADSGYILESYSYSASFGDFSYGYGIEFDESNKIYVSDNQTGIIKVYNSDYSYDKDLVSTNQILRGLSWANDGNLLAVNSGGGRLLKISKSGNIVSDFYVSNSTILREVVTDDAGNFYITDVINNDIVKLNSSGEFVKKWQMKQVTPGSPFYTSGLEIQGDTIIASGANSREYVEVHDTEGNFIGQWDFPYSGGYMSQDIYGNLYFACFTNKVIKTDKHGRILAYIGGDKLQRSESVNVNSLGIVFASDENQPNQIHVFTKN